MDGKIIGLIGVSIVPVAGQAIAFEAVLGVRAWRGGGLALPASLGEPWTVLVIVLFGLLGLARFPHACP